jgi:hypothetical protein
MYWFGDSWGAPICDDSQRTETPEGEVCPHCTKSIRLGDQGVEIPYLQESGFEDTLSYHLDCFLHELGIKT